MSDMIGEVGGKKFMVVVDPLIVINGKVVLIKRAKEPYSGTWVLPGGRVQINELLEDAVLREAKEETGIDCRIRKVLGVYDSLDRDPRGRVISVCYLCDADGLVWESSDEAEEIALFSPDELPALGFDHAIMIKDAFR